jgi:hypothetical protein
VKRRDQQLAASPVLFVLQSERRTRTQHQVEIGSTLRRTSVRVWKNCFTRAGSLIITVGPKNGSLTVNAVPYRLAKTSIMRRREAT